MTTPLVKEHPEPLFVVDFLNQETANVASALIESMAMTGRDEAGEQAARGQDDRLQRNMEALAQLLSETDSEDHAGRLLITLLTRTTTLSGIALAAAIPIGKATAYCFLSLASRTINSYPELRNHKVRQDKRYRAVHQQQQAMRHALGEQAMATPAALIDTPEQIHPAFLAAEEGPANC